MGFVPNAQDRPEVAKKKLEGFQREMDAYLREQEESMKVSERAYKSEKQLQQFAKDADDARHRAEVRAEEWEAIAKELINRGAGRPKPDGEAKPESILAKKIREEAAGDPALAAHFWKNVVAPARAAGKKDEEIEGMIGWTTHDPEPA